MSVLDRLKRTLIARRRGEQDAPADPANAGARETGGGSGVPTQDRHSTTGTTESDEFVGRAGADESGDPGITGAEARGGRQAGRGTGAASDSADDSDSTDDPDSSAR